MTKKPFLSVVLSTYARGQHIRPTIESVLRQSFGDFELIVVGDGCTDDTEAAVRSYSSERVRWLNLPQNTGSQSFPNNEGVRLSRGSWIAYLGHDDIWAPDHLNAIARLIASDDSLDFVISGCVYHGPKDSEVCSITGLFDAPDAPFRHFFPPTSIAHRRDVIARIGDWRDPRVIQPPVDVEFLLRAANAGMRFASTARITAHKFAAGHRYLSYLRASSNEQWEMLERLSGKQGIDTGQLIEVAKRSGQYMAAQYVDYSVYPAGYVFEQNRQNKGISRPALQLLPERVVMEQTDEFRALDWYRVEREGKKYRWSGPNPRPRILLPYVGEFARVSIEVIAKGPDTALSDVSLLVERQRVEWVSEVAADGRSWMIAEIPLKPEDYTVLTLNTPMFRPSDSGHSEDTRRLGIAVGDIALEPLTG